MRGGYCTAVYLHWKGSIWNVTFPNSDKEPWCIGAWTAWQYQKPLYSLHRQTDSKGNFPFMVSNAAALVQKNGHSCKTLIFALYESFYKRGVIILLTCLERIQRHSERHTRHCESLLYIRVGIGIRPTAAAPTRADERECYVKSFKYAAVFNRIDYNSLVGSIGQTLTAELSALQIQKQAHFR